MGQTTGKYIAAVGEIKTGEIKGQIDRESGETTEKYREERVTAL